MLVCHCHAVTDRDIRACVRQGACRVDEVTDLCAAAGGCGGCRSAVEQIVSDERRRLSVLAEPFAHARVPSLAT